MSTRITKLDLFSDMDAVQALTGHSDETRQEMVTHYKVISKSYSNNIDLIIDGVIQGKCCQKLCLQNDNPTGGVVLNNKIGLNGILILPAKLLKL